MLPCAVSTHQRLRPSSTINHQSHPSTTTIGPQEGQGTDHDHDRTGWQTALGRQDFESRMDRYRDEVQYLRQKCDEKEPKTSK